MIKNATLQLIVATKVLHAKEQMDRVENMYQPFDAVGAFDRNRGAIALAGKCR